MKIGWERNWGEPTDESEARKRQNHISERLREYAREHYPTLKKIREREREVERLAKDYIAKEALESLHNEICEEQGDQTERAKILRAAMAWSEKREDIDELKKKTGNFSPYSTYPTFMERIDPHDYKEEYEARSALEWTIRDIMVYGDRIWESNDDWDKDYEFREELENFLNGLASERCYIRGFFESSLLCTNINRYLENPSWHSPKITNFLLVDLVDTHLIELERNFLLGLFPARVVDQIEGPDSSLDPLTVRLLHKVMKKIARYSRLAKTARKIIVIRFEIASETYHARRLIERLKKLEAQDIVIHSLTYALLELREEQ